MSQYIFIEDLLLNVFGMIISESCWGAIQIDNLLFLKLRTLLNNRYYPYFEIDLNNPYFASKQLQILLVAHSFDSIISDGVMLVDGHGCENIPGFICSLSNLFLPTIFNKNLTSRRY